MATVSVEKCFSHKILSPFNVFINQITEEILLKDIKYIKSLLIDKLPDKILENIDPKEEGAALDLFGELRRHHLLSCNNLDLLKELLLATRNDYLAKKVEEFKEKVKHLDDANKAVMDLIKEVPELVALYLLLDIKKESLTVNQIDLLKESIMNITKLKLGQINYMFSQPAESDPTNTLVDFRFYDDAQETVTYKLQMSALKKEKWLIDNNVLSLRVNDNSSINIKEGAMGIPKDVKWKTEDSFLDMKTELQPHVKNAVDVILIVESSNETNAIVDGYQAAIASLKEAIVDGERLDVRIAIITYGYNSTNTLSTAVIKQDFGQEFSVILNQPPTEERCASPHKNPSGLGNGLAKVKELSGLRPDAAKVCVVTSFLSRTDDLQRFSRSDDDIIQLAHTLAEKEIPLYILGIKKGETSPSKMEELLLQGVSHIGGGRYFNIQKGDVQPQISEMVQDIVLNEVSVENKWKIASAIFKDALNNNFGDINESTLLKKMKADLRFKEMSSIKKLQQNGELLEPVDHAVKRLALAEEINDAIGFLHRFFDSEQQTTIERTRSCAVLPSQVQPKLFDVTLRKPFRNASLDDMKKYLESKAQDDDEEKDDDEQRKPDVAETSRHVLDKVSCEEQAHYSADLELASRIVRRCFYRMAYYKEKKPCSNN